MKNFEQKYYCRESRDEEHYELRNHIDKYLECNIPKSLLLLVHEEYKAQGHSQSFERIQERGGFYIEEVIHLLADSVLRRNHTLNRFVSDKAMQKILKENDIDLTE